MALSMEKIDASAPQLVDLVKKTQFALSKYDLTDTCARVALVLDYSFSARGLYDVGAMQAAAEKILAVATQFDDDAAVEVFFFHDSAIYAGELTLENYRGGIGKLAKKCGVQWGGTDYAAAFAAVTEHYFGPAQGAPKPKRLFSRRTPTPEAGPAAAPVDLPVYVAFLTDGATSNPRAALDAARASSQYPIFFQSVGLGDAGTFTFLAEGLNNHGGPIDNFGFFTAPDIAAMKDMALLDGLLNEFPAALRSMRTAGLLT